MFLLVQMSANRDAVRTGADIPFTCPPCKADVLAMEVAMTQDVDDDDDELISDQQEDEQQDESDGPQDCSHGENTGRPYVSHDIKYRTRNFYRFA